MDNLEKLKLKTDQRILQIYYERSKIYMDLLSQGKIGASEAAFCITILQSIEPGKPLDNEVLLSMLETITAFQTSCAPNGQQPSTWLAKQQY